MEWIKKRTKDSKDKADSHLTTQLKDYGIMSGQIWWLRPVIVCDCPATLRDLFRFLLVLPPVRLVKMAFFFFCFFVLENNFKREQRTTPDTAPLSK
ncbi:hypothetical protein HXZ89_13365 [Myroides odoratimimus]|nr:hypothetical protein [Myroides odoratimimus]